jgi:hypothetical protein
MDAKKCFSHPDIEAIMLDRWELVNIANDMFGVYVAG